MKFDFNSLILYVSLSLDNNTKKFICYVKSSLVMSSKNNCSTHSHIMFYNHVLIYFYIVPSWEFYHNFIFSTLKPSKESLLFIRFTEISLRYSIFSFCLFFRTFFRNGRKLLLWHKHAHTHTINSQKRAQKKFSSCQRRKENLFNNVRERWQKKKKRNYVRKWNNFLCVAFNIAIFSFFSSRSINHSPSR